MDEDPPRRGHPIQPGQAAVRTADRQMRHVLRALRPESEPGQLVGRPEGPVEEHTVRALEGAAYRVAHRADAGKIRAHSSGRPLPDPEADAIRGLGGGAGLEMDRELAWHRDRLDQQPRGPTVHARQLLLAAKVERAPGDLAGKAIERPA